MGLAVIGTAATAITNALRGLHATLIARLASPGPDDMACFDHAFMVTFRAIQIIFRSREWLLVGVFRGSFPCPEKLATLVALIVESPNMTATAVHALTSALAPEDNSYCLDHYCHFKFLSEKQGRQFFLVSQHML